VRGSFNCGGSALNYELSSQCIECNVTVTETFSAM
jgi:hypothetical protein